MKEVEVKAKVKDIEQLKKSLIALGCSLSVPHIQEDNIYLKEGIGYGDIKKGTEVLRLRNSNNVYTLTLKKRLENELDKIEHEIIINNIVEADNILAHMNYHQVLRVAKQRIKCFYKDIEICLDEVDLLGSFVEVEKLVEDGDSVAIQGQLFEFLETLGVAREDQVFKGYDTLIYELKQ